MKNEKMERLKALMATINKTKGLRDSAKLHFADSYPPLTRISTGILTLDIVMGGGIPRQRMTQFKGAESAFKTTTLLLAVAGVQKAGGTAAWVQGEEFDKGWATRQGVDVGSLAMIPGNEGEGALERAVTLLENDAVDLLVLDSVQGIPTTRTLEADIGEGGYGNGAPQMWGQFCVRVAQAFGRGSDAAVVWTSQMRDQIGKWMPKGADPADGTKIRSLAHWKSIDIRFRRTEAFRTKGDSGEVYGRAFAVKADKNKTATPEKTGEFRVYFMEHGGVGPGVDHVFDVMTWALTLGLVSRAGAWFTVGGKRFQGEEALLAGLRADPTLLESVREAVLEVAFE